ncbi:unnamed protein product, partial [Durusdinium trenchii]
ALRDFMSAIGVEWPENDEQSDDGESQEESAEESLTDTDEEVEPEEIHANRDLVRQLQLLKALEQELEQLAKLESSARKLPSPSA